MQLGQDAIRVVASASSQLRQIADDLQGGALLPLVEQQQVLGPVSIQTKERKADLGEARATPRVQRRAFPLPPRLFACAPRSLFCAVDPPYLQRGAHGVLCVRRRLLRPRK